MTVADDALRRRAFESAGGLGAHPRDAESRGWLRQFLHLCLLPIPGGLSAPLVRRRRTLPPSGGIPGGGASRIKISSWGAEWKDGPTFIDLVEAVCRALPRG